MLKRITSALVILAVSSCVLGKDIKKDKDCYDSYYELTNEFNELVEQDETCAKELGKCLDRLDYNTGYLTDLKRENKKQNMKWLGIGIGVGLGTATVLGIMIMFLPRK